MAGKKQDFNAWLDMLNIQGNQMNPAIASQLALQSMPPENVEAQQQQQLGGMSMPPEPPPKPQMMTPMPKPVKKTAQPTTQKVGEEKHEIVPRQVSLMSDETYRASPPNSRLMQELAMGEKGYAEKMMLQQNEVDELKRGLDKYRNTSRGFDFRPLALIADTIGGGGGQFSKTAEAMAPESREQKAARLAEMQQRIAGAQGELTKGELEGLRNKLKQIGDEEQRKTSLDITRINAAGRRAEVEKAPTGFRFKPDGSLQAIKGGPAEVKKKTRSDADAIAAGTVVQDLGRAMQLLEENPNAIGPAMGYTAMLPWDTDARRIKEFIDSAKSNIGLDRLQAMRDSSPTGGALGQVPFQQQVRLEQVLGSMNEHQAPAVAMDNMRRISNIYLEIMEGSPEERAERGLGPGSPRHELSFDDFGRRIKGRDPLRRSAQPPGGMTPEQIEELKALEAEGF